MPPEDNQLVPQGDQFTVTIEGLGFVDGSLGGGLDISWDAALLSLISVDTSLFPGDGLAGNPGTETPGFLQDLSVASLFTPAIGPDFLIAELVFLMLGNSPTAIGIALGTFTSGAGDNVWTTATSQLVDLQPGDFSGANINVPVPAAVWLFGSALMFLGFRRKA
jgi:hypothetical protein